MFDSIQSRFTVLRQPEGRDESREDPATLKRRCLHPADVWVMRRRAGRPQPAPRRLPAVARVG